MKKSVSPEKLSPLWDFRRIRKEVLQQVVDEVSSELIREYDGNITKLLAEMLRLEQARLKKQKFQFFILHRLIRDRRFIRHIARSLPSAHTQEKQEALLREAISHFSEEIGGHFNQWVYRLTSLFLPWVFHWLLTATSIRSFLPWGIKRVLDEYITITGELEAVKKLIHKGTLVMLPTHLSHIDSPALGYAIWRLGLPPFAYGAGLNLFSNPLLGGFMSNLGAYSVDRQKKNAIYLYSLKTYSRVIISRGVHSLFFPGGTRSRSGAVEQRIKLGLLGSSIEAEWSARKEGKAVRPIFFIPVTLNAHFILESRSLIDDFLSESKRPIITDDDTTSPLSVFRFFWKFFSKQSRMNLHLCAPVDIYGNEVDGEGLPLLQGEGASSRKISAADYADVKEGLLGLSQKIIQSFHRGNTILTSNFAAFVFIECLRKKYNPLELGTFIQMRSESARLPVDDCLKTAHEVHEALLKLFADKKIRLSGDLVTLPSRQCLEDGVRRLGFLHGAGILHMNSKEVWCDSPQLLYYYRNRLSGYALSSIRTNGEVTSAGVDGAGFLV